MDILPLIVALISLLIPLIVFLIASGINLPISVVITVLAAFFTFLGFYYTRKNFIFSVRPYLYIEFYQLTFNENPPNAYLELKLKNTGKTPCINICRDDFKILNIPEDKINKIVMELKNPFTPDFKKLNYIGPDKEVPLTIIINFKDINYSLFFFRPVGTFEGMNFELKIKYNPTSLLPYAEYNTFINTFVTYNGFKSIVQEMN